MEDDLKKTTSTKNGRPHLKKKTRLKTSKKMEDNLKKKKNGRRHQQKIKNEGRSKKTNERQTNQPNWL
jgi:hypothetical protein